MVDIFTQYAQLAYETGKGHKNPPTPKASLRTFLEYVKRVTPDAGFQDAVDHFIEEHRIPEDQIEEAREQFEKLYDAGVFQFQAIVDMKDQEKVIVGLHLIVWEGTEYVDVNELAISFNYDEGDQRGFI